jgi:NADPH:quinone reductase-like Zn-dependent oxidoreductase
VTIADFSAGELGVQVTTGGEGQRERLEQVAALLADGALQVPVAQTFPLERIGEAYELSRAGHVRGKLVLVP